MCESGRNLLARQLAVSHIQPFECFSEVLDLLSWRFTLPHWWKDDRAVALRGSKIRNKVSVGEPKEGSLLTDTLARYTQKISIIASGCFGDSRCQLVCLCP